MTKVLWTDGSANPNPGPGGFSVIKDGKPVKLGREAETTNIRMEGTAIREAIKYAGEEGCEIHTDSRFWISVLEEWARGWETRGWRKKGGEIKNLDLVQKAWRLYNLYPVELCFTKGHVGTEMNELADEWANRARLGAEVPKEGEK